MYCEIQLIKAIVNVVLMKIIFWSLWILLRLLNNKFNMAPILLLDDIIEHLDKRHRAALFLEVSRHNAQSWFTSTTKDAFSEFPSFIDKINLQEIKENFDGNYHFRYGDI